MSCTNCGRRTTRRHLCKDCGRDAHNESRDQDTNTNTETRENVQVLTLECGDCEHEFEIAASERHKCPACGYDGVRCLDAREVLVA